MLGKCMCLTFTLIQQVVHDCNKYAAMANKDQQFITASQEIDLFHSTSHGDDYNPLFHSMTRNQ
jgi:hypothetical protein